MGVIYGISLFMGTAGFVASAVLEVPDSSIRDLVLFSIRPLVLGEGFRLRVHGTVP